MHILPPLDMALLGEMWSVQIFHPSPRGLVLGSHQLAAVYMLIQEVNVS